MLLMVWVYTNRSYKAGREYLRLIARKTFEELAANEVYSRLFRPISC